MATSKPEKVAEDEPSDSTDHAVEVIRLIAEVVEATMLASRAFSQGRGFKSPVQAKRRAITALFRHVSGRKPTDDELVQMGADTAGVV